MRKSLLPLTFSLLAFAVPAFAQHSHGGGHGGSHGGNGGHVQSQPRHDDRGRNVQHNDRHEEREFHQNHEARGYHYSEPRGEYARHWHGRRFDHEFFEHHWGYGHRFYWNHCGWYGPRFGVGSYFWYDGAYFTITDPIPTYWYDGEVVVIYNEDCDCYYAVNPAYPGARIHIAIRF